MTCEATDVSSLPADVAFFSTPPSRLQSQLAKSMTVSTPTASPAKKAVASMPGYSEVGHKTKLELQDAWLPITESKNGNAYYSAFHTLCSGIGFQVLVLPVTFKFLGWTWGMLCLSMTFIWQIYTLWLLIQLHESVTGILYCRYLHLAKHCFGTRLGTLLVKFPIMYLSGGTCSALIVVGGGSLKLFFEIACGPKCESKPLTAIEWYLVFVCLAVILSQLPNLNSIAIVSLAGGITAVSYCTIIWVVSIVRGRLPQTSHTPVDGGTRINRVLDIVNAVGIIASAFRGHNLVLEIQLFDLCHMCEYTKNCSLSFHRNSDSKQPTLFLLSASISADRREEAVEFWELGRRMPLRTVLCTPQPSSSISSSNRLIFLRIFPTIPAFG